MPVQGVDVSSSQASISWHTAARYIGFAYCKASEGGLPSDNRQRYFADNFARIASVGILRGAYHFFRDNVDSSAQARTFLDVVGQLRQDDLPPMIDVENINGADRATRIARLHNLCEAIQAGTGKRPVLYSYKSFWDQYYDGSFAAAGYSLWIAAYGADAPTGPVDPTRDPGLCRGWTKRTIWQYDDHGTVPGIAGEVDLDIYSGTINDLLAFIHASNV